ncbi:MAG: selenium-dependent xanthine dehydrogenase [Bacteroidetes bacterium]|nr:selenium-dependent xanthine dehydrogenase [Bacteroidota bacterium]MBL7105084.1 selenium-dependent xanthine dehydrogenase [Bacteroidales bacterium]
MITFILNSKKVHFYGNPDFSLLNFLREEQNITSVKDGCSGQAACGACLVEINERAKLSCVTKMKNLEGAEIVTLEGVPDNIKNVLAKAFVKKGAVQCGFCTPGILMRTKILFNENPKPDREEIKKALNLNLCRCTGYKKIIYAIELAFNSLRENKSVEYSESSGKVGTSYPKYQAIETALGKRPFINDLKFDGMLHAALKFSEHPRAKIISIDTSEANKLDGIIKVFTAKDIPGERNMGLIFKDWPLMIDVGETTHYIGDVLAGVVARSKEIAKKAAGLIKVEYEVLKPVTEMLQAIKKDSIRVHEKRSNILEKCLIRRGGDIDEILFNSKYVSHGVYETQRVEHAFLETEGAVALPTDDRGVKLYANSQGVYVDRGQIAPILGIPEDKVRIKLVPTGGGFGGKEDMTVQGHAALYSYLLEKPVKLVLIREDSIRMHPKRHPVYMDITVGADESGKLTAVKLYAVGDTGAYASVGTKVMERVAGHATGGYHVPAIDLQAVTVYTNNIPSGAMRGFGVNQVTFALESCIDEICEKGNFDRWKFRYDNALVKGSKTATGQVLEGGVGIRATLEAIKDEFYKAKYAGLACGIKNSGVGNGISDFSDVRIIIKSKKEIEIQHGWTEMGQGVDTIALQTLCQETGLNPDLVKINVETNAGLPTGMTTSSRATALVGNAIIDAAKKLKADIKNHNLAELTGKIYKGSYLCDWTTKPGDKVEKVITHFAYGYATQLVVLDDEGEIDKVYAAHDAGKIMNPALFEGQIEGAVHMGLGYALTEDLPMKDGQLVSTRMKDLGILKAKDTPDVIVKGVEVRDPVGPYGAKGVGEIGLVPTAAAVANALYQFDKIRRYKLPMKRDK